MCRVLFRLIADVIKRSNFTHNYSSLARDTDGDIVRCRWASSNKSECGGVCDGLPNSALNPDTVGCALSYVWI